MLHKKVFGSTKAGSHLTDPIPTPCPKQFSKGPLTLTLVSLYSCGKIASRRSRIIKLVPSVLQQTRNKKCEQNLSSTRKKICKNLVADLLQPVLFSSHAVD